MGCALPEIAVYNGLGNTESVVLGRVTAGVVALADLTTATRITLRLYDAAAVLVATVDSAIAPTAITWVIAPATGQVDFALGGIGLPTGVWNAKLVVYSLAVPAGELFVPAGGGGYTLVVRVTTG